MIEACKYASNIFGRPDSIKAEQFLRNVLAKNIDPQVRGNACFDFAQFLVDRAKPEIDGLDVDGQRLRLTDHRGKVVLLTFCGNWCGSCRALYPRERELIRRFAGKPFVVLSVNSDQDKETLRGSIKSGEVTWRAGGTAARAAPSPGVGASRMPQPYSSSTPAASFATRTWTWSVLGWKRQLRRS